MSVSGADSERDRLAPEQVVARVCDWWGDPPGVMRMRTGGVALLSNVQWADEFVTSAEASKFCGRMIRTLSSPGLRCSSSSSVRPTDLDGRSPTERHRPGLAGDGENRSRDIGMYRLLPLSGSPRGSAEKKDAHWSVKAWAKAVDPEAAASSSRQAALGGYLDDPESL
ncbi:hypothetical protein ACFTWR_10470 [Streptomyces nigra]|uniref:hypothetical protein n=1 Tax=Streptomyces nigra TaxID=1827580 RepID=UPI0036326067